MKPSNYFFPDGVKITMENVTFNKEIFFLDRIGQRIISKVNGKVVCLTFLQHAWSASILIKIGDRDYFHNLYSPFHTRLTVIHEVEDKDLEDITLTVISNNDGGQTECWLESIMYYDSTDEINKSGNVPLVLTTTPKGNYLVLENDLQISREILNNGIWSPDDVKLFEAIIQEGDFVVDIGANIGACAVIFSKLTGLKGKVFCFEPQRLLSNILKFNLSYNAYSPFEVFNIGLAEKDGEMYMPLLNYSKINNFGGIGVEEITSKDDENKIKVVVKKGAPFLKSLLTQGQKIEFIKIDVESFELPVVIGLTEVIREMKPVLFLEISPIGMNGFGYDYKEIYRLLAGFGYEFFHKENGTTKRVEMWSLPDLSDIKDEKIWDLLAIPNSNDKLIEKIMTSSVTAL